MFMSSSKNQIKKILARKESRSTISCSMPVETNWVISLPGSQNLDNFEELISSSSGSRRSLDTSVEKEKIVISERNSRGRKYITTVSGLESYFTRRIVKRIHRKEKQDFALSKDCSMKEKFKSVKRILSRIVNSGITIKTNKKHGLVLQLQGQNAETLRQLFHRKWKVVEPEDIIVCGL